MALAVPLPRPVELVPELDWAGHGTRRAALVLPMLPVELLRLLAALALVPARARLLV